MSVDLIRFIIFAAILLGIGFVALTSQKFRPYLRKNPAVAFLLGISSGFPLTLLVATLTFWLAKVGLDTATIGLAVMVGIPYTIKFLWAPLADKLHLPYLTKKFGQRRSWLFLIQFFLVIAIWNLGASDPQARPFERIFRMGADHRFPVGDARHRHRRLSHRDFGRR